MAALYAEEIGWGFVEIAPLSVSELSDVGSDSISGGPGGLIGRCGGFLSLILGDQKDLGRAFPGKFIVEFLCRGNSGDFRRFLLSREMHSSNIIPRITAKPPIVPPIIAPRGGFGLLSSESEEGVPDGIDNCVLEAREVVVTGSGVSSNLNRVRRRLVRNPSPKSRERTCISHNQSSVKDDNLLLQLWR